jgi:hypothetical protein
MTLKFSNFSSYNSGLYSILYSRYFDGQQLVCTPNQVSITMSDVIIILPCSLLHCVISGIREFQQGGLIEPRSALLYELLTIKGNQVTLPARFQAIVSRPWLRKREHQGGWLPIPPWKGVMAAGLSECRPEDPANTPAPRNAPVVGAHASSEM